MKKIVILFSIIFIGLGINYVYHIMQRSEKIVIGDRVPDFTLKDQDGKDFTLAPYIGKQPIVIYFYPKDDTPGCVKEACAFRDAYEAFTDLHVKVVGISSDEVVSHKRFAEKYKLPFTLLADTKNEIRKRFGVPKSMLGLLPGRVTYVVNARGEVIYIFNSQFGAEKHITEALAILNQQK